MFCFFTVFTVLLLMLRFLIPLYYNLNFFHDLKYLTIIKKKETRMKKKLLHTTTKHYPTKKKTPNIPLTPPCGFHNQTCDGKATENKVNFSAICDSSRNYPDFAAQ